MKFIVKEFVTALLATLVLAVILCGIYPAVVYGTGQLLFPHQANGSLIEGADLKPVGSEWIGQNFTSAKYFHGRPSAAGSGYDAANSSGTNLGPTSRKLMDALKAAVAQYRSENGLPADALVPADAVTSSASGLDPHISPKNAMIQAARVARERGIAIERVKEEIARATAGPSLGILGDAGVNVLKLNLTLDAIAKK